MLDHSTPLVFAGFIFVCSLLAGLLGSLLGLGGGVIMVPILTLVLGIDFRYAAGASLVSVIATSSGAAAAYVREHLTNLRVAMFLEIGTTAGAITGGLLAGIIAKQWLFIIFGLVLGYSAVAMFRKGHGAAGPTPPDRWADRMGLHGKYFDEAEGHEVTYRVAHSPVGLALMYVAGIISGLLGIGSGALKVTAMDLAMRLPIKVSSATSNFMIGVTAAASAGVYFARGDINPFIAAPVALGVLAGATVGSRLLGRLKSSAVRVVFVIVLFYIAGNMLFKGWSLMHAGR